MRQFTQTSLDPGNCWQTCIACVLDIDPDLLPPQIDYDKYKQHEDGSREWVGPSYMSAMQPYLRKHHGLAYVELHYPPELTAMFAIRDPGIHFLTGMTERSATNGNQRHVVVAKQGEMIWDPHPSRVGLSHEIQWAFLVSFPTGWAASWDRNVKPCVCPTCA
jgi:hypothetical protein